MFRLLGSARSRTLWATSAVAASGALFTATVASNPDSWIGKSVRQRFDCNGRNRSSLLHAEHGASPDVIPGLHRKGLPEYSAKAVSEHDGKKNKDGRILVSYRDGVYDITEFVASHPGGNHILLAAGGSIEPFWDLYSQHKEGFVYDLLEDMRVGNLAAEGRDIALSEMATVSVDDPYANEPKRHPALVVRSEKPFTAEPPSGLLVATQRTPNDLFYKRHHLPVPLLDPITYRLEIRGVDGKTVKCYSLNELKTNFPQYTVDAVVQCAGNRRNEMSAVKKVKGGSWEHGAISNASWTGVRLRDVLADAGLSLGELGVESGARHVIFDGLDADPLTKKTYGASVPIDVAQRVPDVLLAFRMNGETLPRDHGFPVRAIIPGIVGARQVKWLGSVSLSATESMCHWQTNDYKSFSPSVDWDTVDFASAPAIQEVPVVSAICSHEVSDDGIVVRGYAWSGDGKGIIRVDVSGDGGETWEAAELLPRNEDAASVTDTKERSRIYDWTRWTAVVKPTGNTKDVVLVCKAIDSSYQAQPENVEAIWNLRGVLNNSWHRVAFDSTGK